jgi:hypothetical protein
MLNYNEIQSLFGTPLDKISRPQVPFKLKLWHVVLAGAVGYFAYKGIMRSIEEKSLKIKGDRNDS